MGRIIEISKVLIGCYLICGFVSCTRSGVRSGNIDKMYNISAKRKLLVDTANYFLFVREEAVNSGYWVNQFQKIGGCKDKDAWCTAYTVSMCVYADVKVPRTCYSPNLFKKNIVYQKDWRKGFLPKPGQIGGTSNSKRIDHTFIINSANRHNAFITEGNVGGKGGQGVYNSIISLDKIEVIADYIDTVQVKDWRKSSK